MGENPASLVVGLVVSSIIGLILFLVAAMIFDALHNTYPTPLDGQIWNSFVISWSLISASEMLTLILIIVGLIVAPLLTALRSSGGGAL